MGTIYRPGTEGIEHGDHTADLWLVSRGKDLKQMMERMIEGVYGVIASEFDTLGPKERENISINGPDRETVFLDLLNEVLFLFDAESRLVRLLGLEEKETEEGSEFTFHLELFQASVSSGKGGMEVKAATHHDASITDDEGDVVGRILLDL